jgi:5-(carboxyamino)imidazole ribonucleotide synthase
MARAQIGVIGGGQLAWMMAQAAKQLAVDLVIQTPSPTDPAVAIAQHTILAAVDDAAATAQLANSCSVITFENEFVNLQALAAQVNADLFRPSLQVLSHLLDKYEQRSHLADWGVAVPKFLDIPQDWDAAWVAQLGFPVVAKARRHGYDGKGTVVISDAANLQTFLHQTPDPTAWMLEAFVPFERELAVMAARSPSGDIVTYPVVETQQVDQVCRRVFVTQDFDAAVVQQVEAIAHRILTTLNYVGILGIELFLTADGMVLVNELAPRTHNSGHYTLDACATSQFEQILRAVCGMPLGDPALTCAGAVMVNLLGYESSTSDYLAQRQRLQTLPNAHLYWYGKNEARPGRKLGHVTVILDAETPVQRRQQAEAIAHTVETIWYPKNPQ